MIDRRDHVDEGDDGNEPGRRREQRQRDVAQPLPGRCAVELGGLAEVARNRLQPGEVEQHVVAGILPHRQHDQRGERDVRVAEPVEAAHPKHREVVIEQADPGQEDEREECRGGDQRDQRRQEDERANDRLEPRAVVEREGERQGDDEARQDRPQRVDEIVQKGIAEGAVLEDAQIVAETDEAGIVLAVGGAEQRRPGDLGDRQKGEKNQEDKGRQQEQIGPHRGSGQGTAPPRQRSICSVRRGGEHQIRHAGYLRQPG